MRWIECRRWAGSRPIVRSGPVIGKRPVVEDPSDRLGGFDLLQALRMNSAPLRSLPRCRSSPWSIQDFLNLVAGAALV